MKRIIICVLVFIMAVCFISCKKGNDADTSTISSDIVEDSSSDMSSEYKAPKKENKKTEAKEQIKQPDKMENTDAPISKSIRPEQVKRVYTTKFNFSVSAPRKEIFYDSENGNTLPYCLYVPKDYSASKKYPVILFLHGAGEVGTDNTKHLGGIRKMLSDNGDLIAQCILICPQTNEWWALDRENDGDRRGPLKSVLNLLEKIQKNYSCDRNRIYLTGLSMGGYGAWELLEHYGNIFAAGAPLCGFGNEEDGAAFKDIPIRIYHGTADETVPFDYSQQMYNSILSAGGKKVELYPLYGLKHSIWDTVYGDRDFICWMFAQNKSQTSDNQYEYIPYFRIVDSSGKVVISDDDIHDVNFVMDDATTGKVDAEIYLNMQSKKRLETAYISSGGKEFTVYFSNKKFYSFTATKSLDDDIFLIRDIITQEAYSDLRNVLDMAINSN